MSRKNEWCHTWMRHVTHLWVMSRTGESCHSRACVSMHVWRVMSQMKESFDACRRRHAWPRHGTGINESCCAQMSHVTRKWGMSHVNESYHARRSHVTYKSHTLMSHVTHEWCMSQFNESCDTWLSHVTFMNESRHIWISHINGSCHLWMSHITHFVACMWRSYTTWLIHKWHDSLMCESHTRSIICDMMQWNATHETVSHMSPIICETTHSWVTWLIHVWHACVV